MYSLVVEFEILDGHGPAFDALVADLVSKMATAEPDTLAYIAHTQADKPNVRVFYECYRSQDAFLAHGQQPHVANFKREREKHLAQPPRRWHLCSATGIFNGSLLTDENGAGSPS